MKQIRLELTDNDHAVLKSQASLLRANFMDYLTQILMKEANDVRKTMPQPTRKK